MSDTAPLVRHFLSLFQPKLETSVTADFMEPLHLHSWPMNVRELRSVIRRVCALEPSSEKLTDAHLPSEFRERGQQKPNSPTRDGAPMKSARPPEPTREDITESLEIYEGNVTLTAKHLGVSRAQLYRLLKRHEIQPDDHR
jgi:DNA-binding NtrC family response regulator